jgi:hypothetical protein
MQGELALAHKDHVQRCFRPPVHQGELLQADGELLRTLKKVSISPPTTRYQFPLSTVLDSKETCTIGWIFILGGSASSYTCWRQSRHGDYSRPSSVPEDLWKYFDPEATSGCATHTHRSASSRHIRIEAILARPLKI